MTKKISLTLEERLKGINLINEFRGGTEVLGFLVDDIKQFPLSDAEMKKINGENSIENGQQIFRWNQAKGSLLVKDINLSEVTVKYLREKIDEKNKKGEFSLADKAVITLKEKLA